MLTATHRRRTIKKLRALLRMVRKESTRRNRIILLNYVAILRSRLV